MHSFIILMICTIDKKAVFAHVGYPFKSGHDGFFEQQKPWILNLTDPTDIHFMDFETCNDGFRLI